MKTTALTKSIIADLRATALIICFLSLSVLSTLATIGTPVLIGSAGTGNPRAPTTTISTVSASAGNTIIVVFAMDPKAGIASASDSAGNNYTTDLDVMNGSEPTGVRMMVFSARVVTALSSGAITISHPSV